MTPAVVAGKRTAEAGMTVERKLHEWLEHRRSAGRSVAVLGTAVEAPGLVRLRGAPALFWGGPSSREVAAVLLHAMGVPAVRDWPEILSLLLDGLRERRAATLEGLPRLVEDLEFRRGEARTIGNERLRTAWRNEFPGGPVRLGVLANRLADILPALSDLPVVPDVDPNPGVPAAYSVALRGPDPGLAAALFITSFIRVSLDRADAAVALQLPPVSSLPGEAALRHALFRFQGEVAFVTERGAEAAGEAGEWLRRRGTVLWCARPRPDARTSAVAPRVSPREAAPYGELFRSATTQQRLFAGWALVRDRRGAPGTDAVTTGRFEENLRREVGTLLRELRQRTYRPRPLRRVFIPKANGELRALGIPAVRDRVAQAAAVLTLSPLFEATFLDSSFGYRVGKNAHQAIALLEGLRDDGLVHVVNADIRKCFDSIPHDRLFRRFDDAVADPDLQRLVRTWVRVRASGERPDGEQATSGIPQGAPISPLLANLYLHPLDVEMARQGIAWIRYADDTLCLVPSREEAERALAVLRGFVEGELGLQLKEEKSGLASFAEGFDFLGFHFRDREKGIMRERCIEFRQKVLRIATAQTPDRDGRIEKARETVAGFQAYFRTGDALTTEQLTRLDAWGREVFVRFLRPTTRELARIGSLLDAPREAEPGRHDWYVPPIGNAAEPERPAPSEAVTTEASPPAAAAEEVEGIAEPAPDQPDATRPTVATVPAATTPASSPAVVPPVPSTVEAEEREHLARLFLSEGYAKEDLREFLRLGGSAAAPLLAEDGTYFVGLHGCALGKVSQQLVVRKARVDLAHAALRDLKQVVVQGVGVTLSSTLLRELAKRGIPVHFLDWRGVPYADVHAPSKESPSILRGQLRAYETMAGVEIARAMLVAKGRNQAQLLKLYARSRATTDPALGRVLTAAIETMERNVAAFEAVDGPRVEAIRGRLLAIEGRIAAAHFRAIAALVGPERGFSTRTRQQEGFDPVNSMLDYLYGLLYATCHRALSAAGLDPRLGFVHTDGPDGKLSLLYDFVEEFRAIGADRPALALLTRGAKVVKTKGDRLSLPTRRKLLAAYVRNLSARCRYRGARKPVAEIISAQARHLAEVLEKPGRRKYLGFHYNH